jgi:uncharacterized Zn-binding protein involved in type VI secretion
MPTPIACVGDVVSVFVNPFEPPGPGPLTPLGAATTVFAEGRPVATVGTFAAPHGNCENPSAPGYNPVCASAAVIIGIPNILVEGRPIAPIGAALNCFEHVVEFAGAPTVLVTF